ncbi:uncharacterized protein BXZ73DRAFT_48396 [Epithele typhae]|uniref:uncharacterized protein n=1 Tax=Epithele typhae TaxID=378194 RepID=UPI0020073DD3|nr:uncharacterized protein BXZ73DRAFT_48396 [Epithele typhae]KAH9928560.1 hypothetical protein BXZ73DRAFT_48396 [Epithele typhae]
MANTLSAAVHDDHPFALELASLRAAVSRYQHEAHAASLKLQRHSLDSSQAVDHARALERENARLKEELAVLRANPDNTPSEASTQVAQLTLALRRLSDKLTAVEDSFALQTKDLVDSQRELAAAQLDIEAAHALAADAVAREEEGLARERDLERKARKAEEEQRMTDLVVQEYASLVRKLEGRPKTHSTTSSISSVASSDLQHAANGPSTTLIDNLSEGKAGLQKLMAEYNEENERLHTEIAQLHGGIAILNKELEVARQSAEHDRDDLAKALHELEKYRADDNTATKMVSRYMKFSQTSTDTLQKAMEAMKARHAATLTTLHSELSQVHHALEREHGECERIRTALDELTEDIARESYGRRREVSLRLAFLGREENLAEGLRRWVRRAREALDRSSTDESPQHEGLRHAFSSAVSNAETLLDALNSLPSEVDGSDVGSLARLILAHNTVATLTQELQAETVRRLTTERKLNSLPTIGHGSQDCNAHPSSVVQPVPHRLSLSQDTLLLNSQTSPPTTEVHLASSSQIIDTPASGSENIPIIEVVSVPPVEDLPDPAGLVLEPSASGVSPQPSEPEHSEPTSPLPDSEGVLAIEPPAIVVNVSTPLPTPLVGEYPSSSMQSEPLVTSPPELVHSLPVPFPASPAAPLPNSLKGPDEPLRAPKPHLPPPLPLETTNGLALSSFSPSIPSQSLSSMSNEKEPETLLAGLAQISRRYNEIQRGFRDCHMALRELKRSLAEIPSSTSPSPTDMSFGLRKAVERLGDFNEDARVELEIRITDEERIASGYTALLSIPGAMSHSEDANMDETEMVKEIAAFVDGSDRSVAKATLSFTQKLDDLEHDIASIKRALHELASAPEDGPAAASASARTASPSWSAWTPNFLSPSRSASPAPPTFGSVMTSPRLRHSSSISHLRERAGPGAGGDPLAGLRLRIVVSARSPSAASLSPTGASKLGARQRTTSGMFMLGLGMRSSTSFGPGAGAGIGPGRGLQKVPSRSSLASARNTVTAEDGMSAVDEGERGAEGGHVSDVE